MPTATQEGTRVLDRPPHPSAPVAIPTVMVHIRVGAEKLGRCRFPAHYTIANVVGDLPEFPPGLNMVVIDDDFARPEPLDSIWRVSHGQRLFFTAAVPVDIMDYGGKRVLSTHQIPVLGLDLRDLPVAASTATRTATRNMVIAGGTRLGARRLRRAGVVEKGVRHQVPDP